MPDLSILVTGTTTEVGKTFVAAALATSLRERGLAVAARKPVQSFDPSDHETDAEVLATATGEDVDEVCAPHRSYKLPVAPPMAAAALGLEVPRLEDLVAEMRLPERGVVLVEGVGGPRSPMASDGDALALSRRVHFDLILLVADAGLGAINAVLTCAAVFERAPLVFLNRYDATDRVHVENARWLREKEGLNVPTDTLALADIIESRARSARADYLEVP